ncbi:methyl-accepting chemotaxis protein [Ideonella sp. DXS29W]|uniref:Methyl-accepting chemotaxis protein n=1 Tax=Ideonella lacteola TaxID=2984193 RepID=A0ABU9BJ96_9BURK
MRHNTPNIDEEFVYPEAQTLVSMTDRQGRIVYCNPAFVDVSGYSRDELLGQPHNLIRHPDVPAEAFRDLWETIERGQPWSGLVKNRRKDGRYYWVIANVTPILERGAIVGYLSVRARPADEAKAAAEALYRQWRDQTRAGRRTWRLRAGRVEWPGWRGWWARAGRLPLGLRLGAGIATAAGVSLAAGWWAGTQGGGPTMVGAVAASGAAVAAAVWAMRQMAIRPLQAVLQGCHRMAAGDLAQRLNADQPGVMGDLARGFNQLGINLRSVVGDARVEIENMRRATDEIAGGNRDLSARTESQAASLEQTASSMEQITVTVRQSADAAAQAARLAADAGQITHDGNRAVETLAASMKEIHDSAARIGEIIGVIEGIAFQTSLLSLNAAVEAARAGETGRGFAVVAGEVRALATRTAGAAKEVKRLIEGSNQRVADGSVQAERARETIQKAVDAVSQVSEIIQGISRGAQEQLSGISQVNAAVGQLDSITQQNAGLVQQVAESAVGLQARAETVTASVQVFQLGRDDDHIGQIARQDAAQLRRAGKAKLATAR